MHSSYRTCIHAVLAAIILASLLTAPGTQAECIDYSDYIHTVGALPLEEAGECIACAGNLTYHLTDVALEIYDHTDPNTIVLVSSTEIEGSGTALAMHGSYIFVGQGSSGMLILDCTDPNMPDSLTTLATPGYIEAIAVSSHPLCIAEGSDGLHVVNWSDPANPILNWTLPTPGSASDVAIGRNETYAYVADDDGGLQVVYLDGIVGPSIVHSVPLPDDASLVEVISEDYAVVIDYTPAFHIIDISIPTSAAIIYSAGLDDYADELAVGEDLLMIAVDDYLHVYNIANIGAPELLAPLEISSMADVDICGTTAVVASAYSWDPSLHILAWEEPGIVEPLGTCPTTYPYDAALIQGHACVVDAAEGFVVINIDDPTSPYEVAALPVPGDGSPVNIVGRSTYAFVIERGTVSQPCGIEIFRLQDPTAPIYVGGLDTPGNARDLIPHEYLYVADELEGMHVISMDFANPEIIHTVAMLYCTSLTMAYDHLYAADYRVIQVLDLTSPEAPMIVGTSAQIEDELASIAYWNDHIFALDYNGLLHAFDISNPIDPQLVSTLWLAQSSGYEIEVFDGLAYLANSSTGVIVVDVSDPLNMVPVGQAIGPWAVGIGVSSDYLLAPSNLSGDDFNIYPLHCPGSSGITEIVWPDGGHLLRGTPNPFVTSASFAFRVPTRSETHLEILDVTGRIVRTLIDGPYPGGAHQVNWSGTDNRGGIVSPGVYFARLRAGAQQSTCRIVYNR